MIRRIAYSQRKPQNLFYINNYCVFAASNTNRQLGKLINIILKPLKPKLFVFSSQVNQLDVTFFVRTVEDFAPGAITT